MPLDPDRIRVDLVKAKRKAFLSYPQDSKEQKHFLIVAKMSEIDYLTKSMPTDVAAHIISEFESAVRSEAFMGFGSLLAGAFVSFILYLLYTIYPNLFLQMVWRGGWFIGLAEMCRHGYHIWNLRKGVQPFLNEYTRVCDKLKRLNEELKGLSK